MQGLLEPLGFKLPVQLSAAFGTNGGVVDILAILVVVLVAILLSRGTSGAAAVENLLVILKVAAMVVGK